MDGMKVWGGQEPRFPTTTVGIPEYRAKNTCEQMSGQQGTKAMSGAQVAGRGVFTLKLDSKDKG